MAKERDTSKYEELEKKLSYASKNIWSEIDDTRVKEITHYAEDYKSFLDACKSERLTVSWIVAGALSIAVLASVLPAIRAARLHPVEALRYE